MVFFELVIKKALTNYAKNHSQVILRERIANKQSKHLILNKMTMTSSELPRCPSNLLKLD